MTKHVTIVSDTYTLLEAASALRVCYNTVRRLIRIGKLPAVKVGHQVRVPIAGVTALLTPEPREAA